MRVASRITTTLHKKYLVLPYVHECVTNILISFDKDFKQSKRPFLVLFSCQALARGIFRNQSEAKFLSTCCHRICRFPFSSDGWLACFGLGSIAQYCPALPGIAQHYSVLLSIAQHCSALLGIAQHCLALLSIAQHFSELLRIFSYAQNG